MPVMAGGSQGAAQLRGAGLAALAVAGSLLAVRSGRADALDRRVEAVLAAPRGAAVDRVVGVTTDLGSVYGLAGAAGALALAGHRRRGAELAVAGLAAWGVAQAAKPLARRPRPYQALGAERLVAEPAGSSWPSGHTAVITAMAATVGDDLPRPARAVGGALVLGVACSRLYVGVHHATDLIAGAGVGVLCVRALRATRTHRGERTTRPTAAGASRRRSAGVRPAARRRR